MIAVPVFDCDALRQWSDFPLPDDQAELWRLWNQLRSDLEAAADQIDLLTVALMEARSQT